MQKSIASGLRAAGEATEKRDEIKPGDILRVTIGPAPLMVGEEKLADLKAGTQLKALKAQGSWVGVEVERAGSKTTGWVHSKYLRRVVPEPANPTTQEAPQKSARDTRTNVEELRMPPPLGGAAGREQRRRLVTSMIRKAEATSDRLAQLAAYRLAAIYEPDDALIAKKKRVYGTEVTINLSEAEITRCSKVVSMCDIKYFCHCFGPPKVETDVLELRLLLDEGLTGMLRNTIGEGSWGRQLIFLSEPTLRAAQVREKYGEPTSKRDYPNGQAIFSYGRLHIIAEKTGEVVGVVLFLSK